MKALQFSVKGDFSSLKYTDVKKPSIKEGQVLVAVKAASLNPSDVKNVLGLFPSTVTPRIAGRDFAGVVAEGPPHLLGKEVFGCALESGFHQDGSHAEYLVTSVDAVIEKPANISFTQAASLGVPYVTALEVVQRAQLKPNARIVIIGAGAVAKAVGKILRAHQQTPIFAARNVAQRQALKAAGEICLDISDTTALAKKVEQHFGALADFAFDTTGFLIEPAVQCLAAFGLLAVIAAPASGEINFPVKDFYRRGLSMIGVNSLIHNNKICNDFLRELLPALRSGALTPEEPKTVPLAEGVKAYQALMAGDSTKQVLIP